jgi:hypothetical protein
MFDVRPHFSRCKAQKPKKRAGLVLCEPVLQPLGSLSVEVKAVGSDNLKLYNPSGYGEGTVRVEIIDYL